MRLTWATSKRTWTWCRYYSDRDYSGRFADPKSNGVDHRSILSEERSLGSVIKLLTASPTYSPDYNHFLSTIPDHVKELVYTVKRYYQPAWGSDWRSHFTVGLVNGRHANSLRLDGEVIKVNMLRVGFEDDGAWRLFSLRPDFSPPPRFRPKTTSPPPLWCPPRRPTPPSPLSTALLA